MKNKIIPMLALIVVALSPVCRAQSQLAGDWLGTLNAGGTQFHIAWHVVAAKDGSLASTFDNIDQGIFAIPVKSTTLNGSAVTQVVDDVIQINGEPHNVRGTFAGTIDKEGGEVKGTWTQTEPEEPPAELELKRVPAQAAPKPAEQPKIVGDWQGMLSVDGNQLHITLHIAADKDGTLAATADDPDQGQIGTKASAISFKDSKLNVAFDVYNGVYSGTLSADGNQITGAWAQEQPIELNFTRVQAAEPQVAGDWLGTLSTSGIEMRLGLHIKAGTDGALTATFDSIDQGASGIPVNAIAIKDSKLTFTVDAAHISYAGTANKDATEIDGTFTQGQDVPLNFKRAAPAAAPKPAPPSQIDGAWLGTLDTGSQKLRIVIKIVNTADGLTAQLQSPDQGPQWLPATAIERKDNALTISFKALGAVFEGKIAADLNSIDGTFTQMGTPLPLNLKRDASPAASKSEAPTDIDGLWLGNLDAGPIQLRTVFKIANTAAGLTVEVQSPDQSPTWFPATGVTRDGSKLTFELKTLGATYEGAVTADSSSIDGTLTQRGRAMPLSVKRVKDESALAVRRPQNPVKPYPYREEDVTYPNKAAGNTLAATLTIPPGNGPFPAVLLITGSGPNDRDESLLGHKPFLVLSDYLTRKGIVVLRADKRGIGKSTGDFAKATTADFATDAEAGVAYLKTRSEIDPHKIGLVGHSEGGVVAPMAAVTNHDVAFVVTMAGSGVPGDQIIVEQGRLIEMASGVSKDQADADAEKESETLKLVETEKDPAALQRLLGVKLAAEGAPEGQVAVQIKQLTSPWYRYFLTYDPATALRKLTIPVLAINGSLDLQVPPAQNLAAIRKALTEAGNQHAEVDELPGLNHLFQDAKTGSPAEYSQIEETISPVALGKIASWILKQ